MSTSYVTDLFLFVGSQAIQRYLQLSQNRRGEVQGQENCQRTFSKGEKKNPLPVQKVVTQITYR